MWQCSTTFWYSLCWSWLRMYIKLKRRSFDETLLFSIAKWFWLRIRRIICNIILMRNHTLFMIFMLFLNHNILICLRCVNTYVLRCLNLITLRKWGWKSTLLNFTLLSIAATLLIVGCIFNYETRLCLSFSRGSSIVQCF